MQGATGGAINNIYMRQMLRCGTLRVSYLIGTAKPFTQRFRVGPVIWQLRRELDLLSEIGSSCRCLRFRFVSAELSKNRPRDDIGWQGERLTSDFAPL